MSRKYSLKDKELFNLRISTANSRANIKKIFRLLNIRYKERFNGLWFKCIMRNHRKDKTPSAKITIDPLSPHYGIWHCFGCKCSGNIIQLVEEWKDISFMEALTIVENNAIEYRDYDGNILTDSVKPVLQKPKLPQYYESPTDPKEWEKEYLQYLLSRRAHWNLIRRYHIGYVDAGYLYKRVILPVMLGMEYRTYIARSIRNDIPTEDKVTTAPNGKPGLFGSQFAKFTEHPAIIVEGWADKFHVDEIGYPNCMSLQTDRLHIDQFNFLKQFPYTIVIPDGDDGGKILIDSLSPYIQDYEFKIGEIPEGEDPDSTSTEILQDALIFAEPWKPAMYSFSVEEI